MKALSIMQPWASLIAYGLKPVENRTWRTNERGIILIHAGQKIDEDAWQRVIKNRHPPTGHRTDYSGLQFPAGGIVGMAHLTDCVTRHTSDYWSGPFGFVFKDPHRLKFQPMRGQLGFFEVPASIDTTPIGAPEFGQSALL